MFLTLGFRFGRALVATSGRHISDRDRGNPQHSPLSLSQGCSNQRVQLSQPYGDPVAGRQGDNATAQQLNTRRSPGPLRDNPCQRSLLTGAGRNPERQVAIAERLAKEPPARKGTFAEWVISLPASERSALEKACKPDSGYTNAQLLRVIADEGGPSSKDSLYKYRASLA